MKEIDFAIERGFRLFKNEMNYFHFNMIQVKVKKVCVPDGNYSFKLFNEKNKIVYQKEIIIDSINKRIITPNSHEDPLVENHEFYMICFQLWDDDLEDIHGNMFTVTFENSLNEIIVTHFIEKNIKKIFIPLTNKKSNLISKYTLVSDKNCIFRLHLGHFNGYYEEKEFSLKAGECFNFKEYLIYPYVGLQCSYENEIPEIEEKHIVIGQKGMTLSGEYKDSQNNLYQALLPFDASYQVLYSEKHITSHDKEKYAYTVNETWSKVYNVTELMNFYNHKKIHFFETSLSFLEPQYRNHFTYGLNKVISENYEGMCHLDLDICKECKYNSKCVQIVPSGLSPIVFKKNIMLSDYKDCQLYSLIERKMEEKE